MKQKTMLIMMALAVFALVVSACTQMQVPPNKSNNGSTSGALTTDFSSVFNPNDDFEAKTFNSEEELRLFLAENQGSSGYYYGGRSLGGAMPEIAMDMAVESVAMNDGAVATKTISGGGADFSETNNQVKGVDEGDIIKTDGTYIYTISGNTLFIVDAYPGEDAKLILQEELKGKYPQGLFINGDYLIVYGRLNDADSLNDMGLPSYTQMTFMDVYDMDDKTDISLEKEVLFEGNFFQSRMIQDTVYLVTNSYPDSLPYPMPIWYDGGVMKEVAIDSIRYFPTPYNDVSFTTINALDLDTMKTNSETLAIESSRFMYMSKNNMYLAYTEYINEWEIQQDIMMDVVLPELSDADQNLIKKIKSVDSDVLSPYEKENKIMRIIESHVELLTSDEEDALRDEIELLVKEEMEKYDYYEYTMLTRVAVDGIAIDVEANGQIPGRLNNQFSMDEYDDVLRVASSISNRWSSFDSERTESQNMVFTLDENLKELDSIKNIAKGESIYSTRFMGEKLYMVTFRQVDPFFVVDLSDAEDIELLGELKIPGFSRYLHPYSEDVIIGIGRDASETGRTQGLKISLFDVSNPKSPKELATFVAEGKYSSSSAEYEHKAFLFDREKELLVIPAYNYEYKDGSYEGYNGAMVFKLTEDEIELRGLIDHSKATTHRWGSAVERSLFIGDELFTKSLYLLRINSLIDLEGIKDIALEGTTDSNMPIY